MTPMTDRPRYADEGPEEAGDESPDGPPAALFGGEMTDPRVLSVAELRELDRVAVEELGFPSALLMENAANGAARCVARALDVLEPGPVLVVAGPGNNGGDGLAAARHLLIRGHTVVVALLGEDDRLSAGARLNLHALLAGGGLEIVRELGDTDEGAFEALRALLTRVRPAVVLDGLFGTGLNRAPAGAALGLIRAINAGRTAGDAGCVVSLDVPSGLDADTGSPLGEAVRADLTVSFGALKKGFFTLEAQDFLGEVELVSIGVPAGVVARFGAAPAAGGGAYGRLEGVSGSAPGEPTGRGRGAGE